MILNQIIFYKKLFLKLIKINKSADELVSSIIIFYSIKESICLIIVKNLFET